jgi:translation initiation factor 2 beta subunit (eIF-2beta)/eIF-5
MSEETCTTACPVCGEPVTFVKGKEWSVKCSHCGAHSQVQTEEYGRVRLTAEESKRRK